MKKKYFNLSTNDSTKQLKVQVDYELGGMNYFNYTKSPRWIYVYFRWVEVITERGYITESFMMFWEKKDRKLLLKETARDNKKLTEKIASELFAFSDEEIIEYYNNPTTESAFSKFLSTKF